MNGGTDNPGHNTMLRPERSPAWMKQLVDGRMRKRRQVADRRATLHKHRAAVLMLFSGSADGGTDPDTGLPFDASVLLTHRSTRLHSHPGQISFPGGRLDPTDINSVDCALREAWEETGLDRMEVTPLVELPDVHIRATGFPVKPIVAYWHAPVILPVINEQEADDILLVPVAELLDPVNRLTVGWRGWTGPAFQVDGYLVWGMTAGLLSTAFGQAGWVRPWAHQKVHNLADRLLESRNGERPLR